MNMTGPIASNKIKQKRTYFRFLRLCWCSSEPAPTKRILLLLLMLSKLDRSWKHWKFEVFFTGKAGINLHTVQAEWTRYLFIIITYLATRFSGLSGVYLWSADATLSFSNCCLRFRLNMRRWLMKEGDVDRLTFAVEDFAVKWINLP